jgi:phosphatidylserine/phosphatidylglycerophosphate/cardiolipin synthase-like enzyme
MHYIDLTDKIERIRAMKGEKPGNAVNVVMSYSNRFVSFGAGIYGLRGWKKHLARPNDFCYSTPKRFWAVSARLSDLLGSADEKIRICTPYIDKSTFETFLATVPVEVEICLLFQRGDKQMPAKLDQGLSSSFLSQWIRDRVIVIKEIDDLHSRFIVIDDKFAAISSADLQQSQQQKKYQYLVVTKDQTVIRQSTEFFDGMWSTASSIDLVRTIAQIETARGGEERIQTHQRASPQ